MSRDDTSYAASPAATRKRSSEEISKRLRELVAQQEDLRGQLAALTQQMSDELGALEQRGDATSSEPTARRISMDQVLVLLGHLSVAPTESDACEVIVSAARHLLPGTRGALCLNTDSRGDIAVVGIWDADDQWNRPYNRQTTGNPPKQLARRVSAGPTGEGWTFPIHGCGLRVGELRVWPEDESTTPPGLTESCQLLARSAGLVLSGMILQRRLRDEALWDPLTGLCSRAYLLESLPREITRGARKRTNTGIIMLDIDGFSAFNDQHGPEAGDQMLAAVGATLSRHIPQEGLACRYSGERFTSLLPEADLEATRGIARNLHRDIAAERLGNMGDVDTGITASIGIALAPVHAASATELLTAAESGVFSARQAGGDCIRDARGVY